MGVFSDMVTGFEDMPTGGKIMLGAAVVGVGVLGYIAYKNSQSSSTSSAGTSSTTTSDQGGMWQANGSGTGSSAGSGTSSSGSSGSSSTSGGTSSSPTPTKSPTPVPPVVAKVPADTGTPPKTSSKATKAPTPPKNNLGLADHTGTVGVPIKTGTAGTTRVPAAVLNFHNEQMARGGGHYDDTMAPRVDHQLAYAAGRAGGRIYRP